MQAIKITFNTLPYRDDFPGQKQVVIERHAHTTRQCEDIVKAANALNASEIKIEVTE